MRAAAAIILPMTAAVILLAAGVVAAQELEMAVSPSPVGSGARAAGMADAFVAVADDATAASWNPAGLVQLERPEISLVGSFNAIGERFSADYGIGFDSTQGDENFDINYLSVVYPLPMLVLRRNVSLALNYQRKYDFSRTFDVRYTWSILGYGDINRTSWKFKQTGGLSAVTPALAFEINPRLSLGLAVNLWRSTFIDDNGWIQEQKRTTLSLFGPEVIRTSTKAVDEYKDFSGENLVLGLLWNVTGKWNIGARYDSAFTGSADFERTYNRTNLRFPSANNPKGNFSTGITKAKEERDIHFPATIALGAAYRQSDRLTVSTDVTRTDWNNFYFTTAAGDKKSLVDASTLNVLWWKPYFRPTYTVRMGAEYVFIPEEREETLDRLWTLRGGLFYDEEPAAGHPDSFYGVTGGVGLLLNQRVNIDLAYQVRAGAGVNKDFIRGITGFEEDVLQHRVLLSTVIYF